MFFHKKSQDPLSFQGLSLVNLFLPDLYIYIYIYLCTPTVVEIGSAGAHVVQIQMNKNSLD